MDDRGVLMLHADRLLFRARWVRFYSGLNQIPVPYDSITGTVNIPKGLVGQNCTSQVLFLSFRHFISASADLGPMGTQMW